MNRLVVDHVLRVDLESVLAQPRETERLGYRHSRSTPEQFIDFVMSHATEGKTLYVDERPVCIGGITDIGIDCAMAWLAASEDLKPHARLVYRECKAMIERVRPIKGLSTPVVTTIPQNVRFLKALGFTREQAVRGPGHINIFFTERNR